MYWLELAYQAGDVDAAKLLSQFYEEGTGVEQNLNTALQLIEKIDDAESVLRKQVLEARIICEDETQKKSTIQKVACMAL